MIVRQGGGNSGIAEYLEKGAKFDRHYSRDELDSRIIIDGDLQVTDAIINSIPNKDQERYLHITLSFNEPGVTPEKMQAVYEDYKARLLSAYQPGEINTYAEIHWPKTQQLLDKSTGEMYDRHPHIHMVIPKQNLLTGKYANPTGLYERNVNIWEAIQEDVNNHHGLKSPAHSPRISMENYKAVLERHKASQFKSSTGQLKKDIYNAVESRDIRSWDQFKNLVSEHGELKIRNKDTQWEYLAVKLPGNDKFTNLLNPIFSKQYVESRVLPREPLTQYQINNRLEQWERVSRELKYIEDAGPSVKKQYRALDDAGKAKFLQKREAAFYERHEVSEPERKARAFRPGYSKFVRESAADKRSLYELPPRHLVHDRASRRTAHRADMLLSSDELAVLQLTKTVRNDGLHRSVYSEGRIIGSKEQIKSVASQIIFDQEERQVIDKALELERFKEIRLNLKPEMVLAYAQAHYLINPEDHKTFKAKDGSARISFGVNNYNVSDFFTKGLGLEWEVTKPILLSLYDAQLNKKYASTVPNDTIKSMLAKFEETEYSFKVDRHKLELDKLKKREREAFRGIYEQYRYNVNSIYAEALSFAERNKRRALEAFYKLVLEEELKADIHAERERINQLKYPFSEHFKDYLTKEQVIDMSIVDELKERFGHTATEQEEQNGFSSAQPFEMLTGREAARRAKLMAQLEVQGKPYTKYGYSFKDLLPEQKKESVVFYHDSEKLFEARADKVLVTGELDPDKTATALVYSLQRFGNPLDITGSNEFKDQVIDVAARSGLDVKFTDPVLNDALARRLEELGLEGADLQNSISAQSLELDKDLEEPVAVDQALRESKEREIEADLASLTIEMKELAAVSIMQRNNVHEFEPVTAETAELDAALFNSLSNTPAMQARFATDMAKLAQANDEYKKVLDDAGIGSEVMLASHAAVKFNDELQAVYDSNRNLPAAEMAAPSDIDPFAETTQVDPLVFTNNGEPVSLDLDRFKPAEPPSIERLQAEVAGYGQAEQEARTTLDNLERERDSLDVFADETDRAALEERITEVRDNLESLSQLKAKSEQELYQVAPELRPEPVRESIEPLQFTNNGEPVSLDLDRFKQAEPPSIERLQAEIAGYGQAEQEARTTLDNLERERDSLDVFADETDRTALAERITEARDALEGLSQLKAQSEQELYQVAPELRPEPMRESIEQQAGTPAMPNFTHNGEPATLDLERFQQQEPQPVAQEPEAPQATAPAMPNFTHNGQPATIDLSRFQPQQVEAKLAELQSLREQINDPQWVANGFDPDETISELNRYAESFMKLDALEDGMSKDAAADRLARSHLMAYTEYQGTPYEQEMAEVIIDGMESNDRYRLTIQEESSDSVDLALGAAQIGRERAILDKEVRKEFDMGLMQADQFVKEEVKQMFALEPDSKLNAGNLSAKTAANDLEAIKLPASDAELKQTAKFVVEKLDEIRKSGTESGKAEIRRAGQAVAALTAASPALATEITAAADIESKPYIAAIVEQGHNLNTTQLTQAQQAKGPDMEM
jgi:hypothetical protein